MYIKEINEKLGHIGLRMKENYKYSETKYESVFEKKPTTQEEKWASIEEIVSLLVRKSFEIVDFDTFCYYLGINTSKIKFSPMLYVRISEDGKTFEAHYNTDYEHELRTIVVEEKMVYDPEVEELMVDLEEKYVDWRNLEELWDHFWYMSEFHPDVVTARKEADYLIRKITGKSTKTIFLLMLEAYQDGLKKRYDFFKNLAGVNYKNPQNKKHISMAEAISEVESLYGLKNKNPKEDIEALIEKNYTMGEFEKNPKEIFSGKREIIDLKRFNQVFLKTRELKIPELATKLMNLYLTCEEDENGTKELLDVSWSKYAKTRGVYSEQEENELFEWADPTYKLKRVFTPTKFFEETKEAFNEKLSAEIVELGGMDSNELLQHFSGAIAGIYYERGEFIKKIMNAKEKTKCLEKMV